MKYSLTTLIKSASLALGVMLIATNSASAAIITVNTFVDENTDNGECSLREAIINANGNDNSGSTDCEAGSAGVDTIVLAAGTYVLSIAGSGEDAAATGDLDITDVDTTGNSLVITGAVDANGTPSTIIDAAGIDRIFDIFSPGFKDNLVQGANFDGVNITLENLKLINGYVDEGVSVAVDNQSNGGAVFNWRFSDLTIDNCVFDNNQAVWDGKFDVLPGVDGILGTDDDIEERTLSGHGGAVYSRGSVDINGSTFSNNMAYTTFDENGDSIIEGENEKNGNGGGLFIAFTSTITNSSFINNTASNGGGLNTTGGEPTIVPGNMTISGSTFSGNWAVMGGGVNNVSPQVTLDIINSTFSGNTSTDMGGGINSDADVHLKHVTVVDNQVVNSDQNGAGINYFGPGGSYTLANTLLSNNKGKSLVLNCGCTGGTILACVTLHVTSLGGNISSDFNCGLNSSSGDLQGPDAKVLALADNGGPTQTHALDYDSLAIDAGKDSNCINAIPAITTDQRGVTRPEDGDADGTTGCDIGAYERKLVNADLILSGLDLSSRSITVDDELVITVSAGNTGPEAVTAARVDVAIPAELSFISGSVDAGASCSQSGDKVSCPLGDLGASASANITLVTSALGDGSFDITATISALESDTDSSNNSQQLLLTINPKVVGLSSSGGGLCSYNPNAEFDLVLPAILFIALGYLGWRRNEV